MANITLIIPFDELKEAIVSTIKEELQKYNLPAPQQDEGLLTRKEVAELFNITLTTLNKWRRYKLIKAYRIGGAIRFKKTEVMDALSGNNSWKKRI